MLRYPSVRLFIFVLILHLFTGCSGITRQKQERLEGTWRLYNIESANGNNDSFTEALEWRKQVKDGLLLCLFKDGTSAELSGEGTYVKGQWTYAVNTNELQLADSAAHRRTLTAKMETNEKSRTVLRLTSTAQKLVLTFVKEAEPVKNIKDDPFYSTNNEWRQRPKSIETEGQRRKRLANYFKHVALILKAAKDREQPVVSFEFSQGPIRIYNGGIGIYPYEAVPQSWKDTFYDDNDAALTYAMYQQYLRESTYKGAGTGEWIEDDYNILLSIYSDLTAPVK